jgi:hypothetical protein
MAYRLGRRPPPGVFPRSGINNPCNHSVRVPFHILTELSKSRTDLCGGGGGDRLPPVLCVRSLIGGFVRSNLWSVSSCGGLVVRNVLRRVRACTGTVSEGRPDKSAEKTKQKIERCSVFPANLLRPISHPDSGAIAGSGQRPNPGCNRSRSR